MAFPDRQPSEDQQEPDQTSCSRRLAGKSSRPKTDNRLKNEFFPEAFRNLIFLPQIKGGAYRLGQRHLFVEQVGWTR